MDDNEAYSYFLSLLDDVERVVASDPLCERIPQVEYFVSDKAKPEAPKESIAPHVGALSPVQTLRRMYHDCHDCMRWMDRDADAHPGVGSSHPLVFFVLSSRYGNVFLKDPEMKFMKAWMESIRLDSQKECYVTSLIKCPGGDEKYDGKCVDLLREQVRLLKPRAMFMMGASCARMLTGRGDIDHLRGKSYAFESVPTVLSYEPGTVLSNQGLKRDVWDDLKKLSTLLGIEKRRAK